MTTSYLQKCSKCKTRNMAPRRMDYTTKLNHDNREYTVTVPQLEILECTNCGHQIVPDESFDQLVDELRRQAGLLTPLQIREHRKQLNLTQEELANLLGIAVATLSRWETGGQIQQRVMNDFLLVFFNVVQARRYLSEMRNVAEVASRELAVAR